MFMKIMPQMYPWTKNVPLNLGNNPDSESRSGVRTPDPAYEWNHKIVKMKSVRKKLKQMDIIAGEAEIRK